MKILVSKVNELVLRSTLLSILIFFSIIIIFSEEFIKNELQKFDLVATQLEEYKNNILLMGLLLENKINDESYEHIDDYKNIVKGGIYKLDIEDFTQEERLILNESRLLSNYLSQFYQNKHYLLYFKSYVGRKLFTAREIPNYELSEHIFSGERQKNPSSTLYGSSIDLKDRIIVSGIYIDDVTGEYVTTILSPVYKKDKIIGDIGLDIYIENGDFLHGKEVSIKQNGLFNTVLIESKSYPLHLFSYSKEYFVDNNTIFIYKVPFTKVVIDFFWIFISILCLMFYILYKLSELKDSKKKLNHVESIVNLDELTGIYNRSILIDENLLQQVSKVNTSVIAIDGDKLKSINDNYGHNIGDEAIKQISHGMRITFKDSDYLVRMGGDEFLVILPNCTVTVAERLAIDLQENVSSVTFSHYNISIKVSTGVTSILKQETLKSAIKRADALLYSDKEKRETV